MTSDTHPQGPLSNMALPMDIDYGGDGGGFICDVLGAS